MLFSLFKHYLELYIADTALNVSMSLHCFTISVSRGVENYFPRLWGTASLMLFYLPYYWSQRFAMLNQPIGNHGCESSDVVRFDLGSLLQG